MTHPDLTRARAAADQQRQHAAAGFDSLVDRARRMLAHADPVDVWAVLASYICEQLGLATGGPSFAGEMLAAAAIRAARQAPDGRQ